MSDVLIVFGLTAITFIIFAAIRLVEVERARRRRVAESWRKEEARRERDNGSDEEDDDTKTLPVEEET